ncbi:antiviral helicase SKI2 [Cryptococcus neoformans var. grubii Br795]|uniref:Antiviral helicase SKI2 n=1 Tax=Cryptococcus neoformans Tu259-1 TaxID=1230072 RepID=A0A854Q6B8_CRYNE|nr:antiviral helicase SKI2 [Cryptococcus neoformans var. grubii AD1-83a]OXG15763.1 antiviral helicase SKI2 [Cryptococcus neoformans var. grubii Tu259-1]OXG29245.1 antiviral helicase SKI2 [Cryptococcus neoformans var. grubii Bt15]OXG48084.1 antiviral helicase SKI2 [Cryptococcus neoformans var. grubii Th84]OXG53734.1 antiviral helicase SKI2 [Cryptococcus neoformans var. grubii MW-RSA1955]OXG57124.1 antiviral helicase SKI2 [Cryptococcus neoformans var. grubii CHC193]OXG60515.1 antiviral helicase
MEQMIDIEDSVFLELLNTAANPSSVDAIPSDELAVSLGIDGPLSREQALEILENEVLAPVHKLQGHELGQWQVQPPISLPTPPFDLSPLHQTHTVTPSFRGINGDFTHWREALAPKPPAHPTLSSSTTRAPGSLQNFVRGKGSYAPFLPGGLEAAAKVEEDEGEDEDEDEEVGWKTRAPGMKRGAKLDGADEFLAEMLGQQSITAKAKRRRRDGEFASPQLTVSRLGDKDQDVDGIDLKPAQPSDKNIDDLLPTGRLPAPPSSKKGFKAVAKKEWAHVVDVNQKLENFNELVPEMAKDYPFELDNFQKEAVYRLEMGDSVFVAAHTSAGKTVVAEYAIALAAKHMTKAIYTSPIKALSNQKFRDFKTTFEPSTVGILTGDVQINAEGSCLIMTTEILRSMLYKGADLIRDVEFVIFDEVHYVNDAERGVVWEEVIIMLPEHVNIILLSATVPNTKEFADWVGRTKKKDIYVISTPMRPVPLEHFLWAGRETHRIVSSQSKFLMEGYSSASDALRRKQDKEREANGLPPLQRTGGRGGASMRAKDLPTGKSAPFTRIGAGRNHTNRGGGNGPPQAAFGGGRGGRGGGRGGFGGSSRPSHVLDQNIWTHLISYLKKNTLLPVVNFVFSKKRCEEYAQTLSLDLCTAKEKSEVHITWERALTRLKGEDKTLPQILRMRELLGRGIGVHHGGLLPLVKEVVEILFARGLVKVLFATETFAMGVNMPAKSVVFSGIRKHDGTSFRNLLPGEYTQMAGRAGRRGLDTTGTVIILSGDELPSVEELNEMMLGVPNRLSSQFRLTYNMILNLLRVEALKVEEMIKRSFSENATQKMAPEQQRVIAQTEKELAKLPKLECDVCNADIDAFYNLSTEASRLNAQFLKRASWSNQSGKLFVPGRVVVLRNAHFPGNLAVILGNHPNLGPDGQRSDIKAFRILVLVTPGQKSGKEDLSVEELTPRWPPILPKGSFPSPTAERTVVDTSSISFVINHILKYDFHRLNSRESPSDIQQALDDLTKLHEELSVLPELPEADWSRLRDIDIQSLLKERTNAAGRLSKLGCQLCGDFADHYATLHERKQVEQRIQKLKLQLSDQNLELLPDYESRVEVLKRLSFIDENATVLLKGRVACEINSAPELILTELILENILADYTPEEVVALLSIFVFVEKTESQPIIPTKLQDGLDVIYNIAEQVEREQDYCQVQHDEFATKYKPGLVEVVYEWARGMPFNEITNLTDVPEGTIVRVITRLDETCREVRDAARVIGDADLFKKMEEAQGLIRRDIVFAASLYL